MSGFGGFAFRYMVKEEAARTAAAAMLISCKRLRLGWRLEDLAESVVPI